MLPPIPETAIDAARAVHDHDADTDELIAAAWPHLYAAALRHAADEVEYEMENFPLQGRHTRAHWALHRIRYYARLVSRETNPDPQPEVETSGP